MCYDEAMNVLFMGSPKFAVPSLDALHDAQGIDLAGVFTQPDRPAGRGRQLTASDIKLRSSELGLGIFQPDSLKSGEIISTIHDLEPELIIVVAYGNILPTSILGIPEFGAINVHASLLPRWRGAAPIQAAIMAGDPEIGVTIMLMDSGLDTGPILSMRKINNHSSATGGELTRRLATLGADLLIETLPKYIAGNICPISQNEQLATYAPMLKKSDGVLNFNQSAEELERQVRAYEPWPSSYFLWNNRRIVVRKAEAITENNLPPGMVALIGNRPAIGANPGVFLLKVIQPSGKKEMLGEDFLRGAGGFIGTNLLASGE